MPPRPIQSPFSIGAIGRGDGSAPASGGSGRKRAGRGSDAPTIPVANPLLGLLADNGGPTRTMTIAHASPAVDAADNADCPATDQRGVAPVDGNGDGTVTCDIGAYEVPFFLAPSIPVPLAPALPLALALLVAASAALRSRRRTGDGAISGRRLR